MPEKLTAQTVANAGKRAARYEIADLLQPGLRLVVQPSGSKAWAYRYERPDGKRVKVTLGPATGRGTLTLAEARAAANAAMRSRVDGADPADAKRAARMAALARIRKDEKEARRKDETVEKVLGRFYSDHVNGLKSAHDVKRLLNKELAPWLRRRVDDISRADAIKLLDGIKARGAGITANRVRANARKFFNWCIGKGLIDTNPFANTLPAKTETSRDRILTDDEVRLVSLACETLGWPWSHFFRLALYTGQRREELAAMRWDEINLSATIPTWTLPKERTKNGRVHVVPLPESVVLILNGIERVQIRRGDKLVDSPFVLTTTGESSISGFSKAKAQLDRAMLKIACDEAQNDGNDPEGVKLQPWVLHDFRRTVASGMAALGIDIAVAELVLNHRSGTFKGIVSVYQRHDFFKEKAHALAVWAAHVNSLTKQHDPNVIPFKAEA